MPPTPLMIWSLIKKHNMKKIEYKIGEFFMGTKLVLIENLGSIYGSTGRATRKGLFRCFCGNIFEGGYNKIKGGHTLSCGCAKIKATILRNTTHGLTDDPTYKVWMNMKNRVFNDSRDDYKHYGGRGIMIFPSWIHDFQLFYDYVSALPNYKKKKYSIDRIDTNGNYEPGNLRWVTQHIQTINIRKRKDNTSGYFGVGKLRKKWQATVGVKYIGCAETPEEAVMLRNNYIIANNLTEYKIQEVR